MLLSKISIRQRLFGISVIPLTLTCISLLFITYVQLNDLVEEQVKSGKAQLLKTKKLELKNMVDMAYSTIKPLYETGASREEAVKIMRSMKFGKDGYIFGYTSESIRVFVGQNNTGIGTSYQDFKDVNGVYLINDLVTAGRKNNLSSGDNFVSYHFPKPGEKQPSPKLSYSVFLEKWDLMIGTGIYIDDIEQQMLEVRGHVEKVTTKMITSVTIISILLIALMIVLCIFIVNSILTPLNSVSESIRELGEGDGDLTQRVPVNDKFETGNLAQNLNTLLASLQKNMKSVYKVASDVDSEIDLLVKQTENIRSVCTQQQTAVELVASASTEMASSSGEVLHNAQNASEAASLANNHGTEALEKVSKSSTEMGQLMIEINKASEVVQQVGSDVENIGAILQVIESIAGQTNLLALNAAIEAARAGEQGRGFAVVADEVRNLASKTQGSTEEIQQMITKLQIGSKSAVDAMQSSIIRSTAAEVSVTETSMTLNDIAESVSIITNMNAQIASASQEQSTVGEDIGKQIVEISMQTTGLKDIAEQNSKTSESLRLKAAELNNIVSQFKL